MCCRDLVAIIVGIGSVLAIGWLLEAFEVVSGSSTRLGSFGRFDLGQGRMPGKGTCWSLGGSWRLG